MSAAAPQPVVYVVRGRPGPDDRPALPPGHPVSWGAITEGTLLAGAAYPRPPILPKRDDAAWRQMLAKAAAAAEPGVSDAR